MKESINIKSIILLVCLLFLGCFSKKEGDNHELLSIETILRKIDDRISVEVAFSSKVDTSVCLDERMLIVGCPFYQEIKSFYEIKPSLNELKFSQILLENKEGNFRVFSSPFVDNQGNSTIIMSNCAFMGKRKITLEEGNIERVKLGVIDINNLKVTESDRKIRVHLYYKDSKKNNTILTSTNWLSIGN